MLKQTPQSLSLEAKQLDFLAKVFPFLDFPLENFVATMEVNVTGTFLCAKHAVRHMLAQEPVAGERGSIITVASVEGLEGTAGGSSYNASKGGVVNLTRALALELAPDIRVNCVCPGYVDTDMVRQAINAAPHPAQAEAALEASAPLNRRTAIPPSPGGVMMATIVSSATG